MSTKLHDIPNNALLGIGASPRAATGTVTGSAIDCITGDGRCTAIQLVGSVGGTSPTLAGKIQESANGSSGWADVATFTTVNASDNSQMVSFDRTQRYLRYVGTITGTTPTIPFTAVILEQKKNV
jgi:hypothetical protein